MSKTVLITGITGFIAMQCAREMLEHGYTVRGTLRSSRKAEKVRNTLERCVPGCSSELSFIETDLGSDDHWPEAVDGCDGILHVASPFPAAQPKNEDDLIIPARDGTLRVLRAAASGNVRRVVQTSSMAAVYYGNRRKDTPLTEKDWSDLSTPNMSAYSKSKTIAEQAAWEFVKSPEGNGINLTAINPGLVLGPALNEDFGTSLDLLKQMMDGSLPASPPIHMPAVDVRDVAAAHRLAFENESAIGHRYLLVERAIWLKELAQILKKHYPQYKAPTTELPLWLVRFMANFRSDLKTVLADMGHEMQVDNQATKNLLGRPLYSMDDMVVAAAESLIASGALKKR